MKKTYLKPNTKVNTTFYELSLLVGTRATGGGPTNTGGDGPDLPGTVGETGENNPGYGHGQGDPSDPVGGGNRSKAYQVWEN
jgi:hypothetical protein